MLPSLRASLRGSLRGSLRAAAAALTCLGALTLTACDGSTADGTSPSPSSATPSGSGSGSGSTPAEPTVTPATGPVMEISTVSMHVPEGWVKGDRVPLGEGALMHARGVVPAVALNQIPYPPKPLDQLAESFLRNASAPPKSSKVLDPVTVDGRQMFHVTWTDPSFTSEAFGLMDPDDPLLVWIQVNFEVGTPDAERKPLVDSVLATVTWK